MNKSERRKYIPEALREEVQRLERRGYSIRRIDDGVVEMIR